MSSSSFNNIQRLLDKIPVLIIDGALATELEARGCDLKHSLWSAKTLQEHPKLIQQVHEDYFRAGADIAISASYQAAPRGLRDHGFSDQEAQSLIRRSVTLAQDARYEVLKSEPQRKMLVVGSVGPYGAYLANGSEYRGDYSVSHADMIEFHHSRIETLLAAGVDLLAFETLPSMSEAEVLLELLQQYPNSVAWFSFTLRDPSHISDGSHLDTIVPQLDASDQVIGIGFNCVAPDLLTNALSNLAGLTKKPLVAYPNSGETWDACTNTWSGNNNDNVDYGSLVKEWYSHGARLVGGCCRTTPEHVKLISQQAQEL